MNSKEFRWEIGHKTDHVWLNWMPFNMVSESNEYQFHVFDAILWSFSVLDAWNKFPSGIFITIWIIYGMLSHWTRNGVNYKTQYCIGQLIRETEECQESAKQGCWFTIFWQRLDVYRSGPSISLGNCLPHLWSCGPIGIKC